MSTVRLQIVQGPRTGTEFLFDTPRTAIFGRGEDCGPTRLADQDRTISRHHFALDVRPPEVLLRDLGSLTGTYVNGSQIGGRGTADSTQQHAVLETALVMLRDGDMIRIGQTVLAVRIDTPQAQPPVDLRATYAIQRQVHAGPWGAMYLAHHRQTARPTALKVMRLGPSADDPIVQRVLSGMTRLRPLAHPYVVELREYGAATGSQATCFLSMEFCEGGSLADSYGRGGRIPVATALTLLSKILEGLAFMHAQGISQGGLTSKSLLWTRDATLGSWVLKLGLPSVIDNEADQFATAQDVAALCTIFNRLCSGDDTLSPTHQSPTALGVSVRLTAAGVPAAVAEIIETGLDASRHFVSAVEMLQAFEAAS